MRIAIDLFFLLILLLANGFLAMAEMSIVSSRPSRLQAMAGAGKPGAATALKLLQSPGDFLSTVQIGITLIGIFAGAFGGATLATPLADQLQRVGLLAPYATQIAIFVVVLATTYLALVVAELTPKRIALSRPETIACLVAPVLDLLSRPTRPLVSLLDRSSGALSHLFGVRGDNAPAVTDDEVRVLLRQGAQLGVFKPIEEEIVAQLFRLSDRRASAIMTPRTEIAWIDVNQSLEEIRNLIVSSPHSRFPLAEESLDHVIGVVYARDLLVQHLTAETINLRSLAKPALFVPENMSALDLVEQMRKKRTPVALIINEYGGVEGSGDHHGRRRGDPRRHRGSQNGRRAGRRAARGRLLARQRPVVGRRLSRAFWPVPSAAARGARLSDGRRHGDGAPGRDSHDREPGANRRLSRRSGRYGWPPRRQGVGEEDARGGIGEKRRWLR
nr:hemolysin family protein [Caldilinea sp.]